MLRLLPTLFLLSCLTGCTPNYTILEHSDVALPVGEKPHLLIEMMNGEIAITTAHTREVTGKLTKRGVGIDKEEAEKELNNIGFDLLPDKDGKIVIKVKRNDGSKNWNSSGAEASLQVPQGSKLELVTSNARIRVEGKNQGVAAKTRNGSVLLKETDASVDVTTTNGSVTCDKAQGPVRIDTSNATVNVTGRDLVLDCKSTNGSIRCKGNLLDGDHRVTTNNGHITITLPRDSRLNMEAGTSNGRISNDFSLTKTEFGYKSSKTNIKGTIGSGEISKTLTLKTSNSSISIKKESDKKSKEREVVLE